jgi:hypothetical protein
VAHTHQKRRSGRPALAPEARRSVLIALRLTPAQATKIEAQAAEADETVAAYVFRLAVNEPRPVPSQSAFNHAGEISRLATRLCRIERLADAGRPVSVPAGELRRLADALQETALRTIGLAAGRRR